MSLFQDAARTMIDSRRDEIMALPVEQRKAFINSVIDDLSRNPVLNIQTEPTQKTSENLTKLEAVQATHEKRMRERSGLPDEILQRQGAIGIPSSDLKLTRRNAELESQGVITDRDLEEGSLEIGFGVDPVRALKGVLSEKFGQNVPVFKSGDDIIYIDPTDNKPIKVNPNLAAGVGQSLPVAGEIAAAFIGRKGAGSVAGQVAKESGLAGVGAAVGEFTRLALGKAMNVHDLDVTEMIEESGVQAAWAAGVTLGIGTLISSVKGLANFRSGRVFNREDALEVGVAAKDADEVVEEANKLLPEGTEFKPTLAQKGDDTLVESAESELRGRSEFAQKFRERDVENLQAQQASLEKVGQQEVKPFAPSTVGEVAEKQVERQIAKEAAPVKVNEAQLKSELDQIGKVQKETVGKPTLEVIKAKEKTADDAVDTLWDDVRKTGGFDEKTKTFNIPIEPQQPTQELSKVLSRQARTARTGEGASATKSFFNKDQPADLGDFQSEISRLKSRLRKMKTGAQASQRDAKDVNDVIKAMEQDRNLALVKAGRQDLMDKIKLAEVETANFHDTFKRSVIGDLTELTPNGTPKIKSQTFVDDIMKRDDSEINDFFDVIGDNLEIKNQWKQGIGDKYKREVFSVGKDGKTTFSQKKNQEFLKKNQFALEKVFSKKEMAGFLKTGNLHEKVAAQTKRLDQFTKQAKDKWGAGVLSKLDPQSLNKFITGNTGSWITPQGKGVQFNVSKIKFVKNLTKNDPGAWQAFKNDFKKSLQKDLTNVESGKIDSKKLSEWISPGNKDTVVEVMGEGYFNDLIKINKVVKMLNKPLKKLAVEESRLAWVQSVRAGVAPPLTRRGRAFTALLLFDKKAHHKATIDALLDPKTIREVAQLSEHDIVTRRVMEKAFSLGLGLPEE